MPAGDEGFTNWPIKKTNKNGKRNISTKIDYKNKKKKGYKPELDFNQRKEILEFAKYLKYRLKVGFLLLKLWHAKKGKSKNNSET